jgi:hypothetical protein
MQQMMTRAAVMLLTLAMTGQASPQEPDVVARFDGGIGVIPVANAGLVVNTVRGVPPAPGPWRIASLRAEIDTYGRIKVRGRGLLLANGNFIGQNGRQRVFATLICEAEAPVPRSTDEAGVPIEPNGDFRIDDTLDPVPSECPSPVLLIRNTGGVWFAAGIPKLGDDDD